MIGFGVDIGGSGVKGATVDLESGTLTSDRYRIPTSQDSSDAVLDQVIEIADHFGWDGQMGVAVPGVVNDGVIRSAVNLAGDWDHLDIRQLLSARHGATVRVLNDADAAGLAEVRYGAAKDVAGVVIMLTFGTGIGSAVFLDGELVPNTEFGHLELGGMELEHYAASRLVEDADIDMDDWVNRADTVISHLEYIFSPSLFILGGGISKQFSEFKDTFTFETPIVPAVLRNGAGIVGAAMAGSQGGSD